MQIQELQEQRAKLIGDARSFLDQVEEQDRDLNEEESKRYDAMLGEASKLADRIERERRQIELEREITAADAGRPNEGRNGNRGIREGRDRAALQMDGFRSWLKHGAAAWERAAPGRDAEGRGAEAAREFRALSAGTDTEGGYLVAPERFINQLIQDLDDRVHIRSWATTQQVSGADSLGVPSLDADPDDADWTTELATGREDQAMRFGKRALHPHPLAKRVKISNELLRRSTMPVENIVRERLAYKFAVTEEKAFLTGSGAGQPLGVFTASSDGIPASRDVATGNEATKVTTDGLIEAKFAIKAGHRRNARWLFHRDAIKQIAKLKDSDGQYIWSGAVREGEPDRLLGLPYFESEFAPNTFTTGLYAGILGDFSYYWIADDIQMQIQRLMELYAETNQVGLILRAAVDAMPVLAEAFVRVKLG